MNLSLNQSEKSLLTVRENGLFIIFRLHQGVERGFSLLQHMNPLLLVCVLLSFTSGCVTPFLLIEDVPVKTLPIRCDPPRPHLPLSALTPTEAKGTNDLSEREPFPKNLSTAFSHTALRIAKPLGLIPLLGELVELENRRTQQRQRDTLQLLAVREEIVHRIMFGTLKIASAAAEADCEEDRAQREAARLVAAENLRAKRQTQIALVSAGLSSIAGGALSLAISNPAPGAAISITSGVIETLFGGLLYIM